VSADGELSVKAPFAGVVVSIAHAADDTVGVGAPLVVLEAMKMEHSIRAPHDGVVGSVAVRVGQQVETGAMLVVVEEQTEGETT
jgi:biotin carboxyl carrier protein